MAQLFFGVGTGRVASMALANALNCEAHTICLHEGKFRDLETPGEQLLPFLTLENRRAYEYPGEAERIVSAKRGDLAALAADRHVEFLGDVAYNYAPFIGALASRYASAKFIFQFRDCLGFVRSCTAVEGADEAPVGWPPEAKELTKVERFIGLGRIQPRQSSPEASEWPLWSFIARNIWLWAETNRLIIEAIETLSPSRVIRCRFEDFQQNPVATYESARRQLGFANDLARATRRRLTDRPINSRQSPLRTFELEYLSDVERHVWERFAEPIRTRLGYLSEKSG